MKRGHFWAFGLSAVMYMADYTKTGMARHTLADVRNA